jgi:hypothetical protein
VLCRVKHPAKFFILDGKTLDVFHKAFHIVSPWFKVRSGLKKCQQVGVELVCVRDRETVGRARVNLQGRVLDQLR